jgi:mono/diheme cytochrome c family protein
MRSPWRWVLVLAITVIVAGIGIYAARLFNYGLSARSQPTPVEALVASGFRHAAIPANAKHRKNPMPATPEMLEHGRNHWADHCATCHANNGSGDTEIGRNLYPRVPDMRLTKTQSLSDGELYYIIRNGVRMTGMPAWGKPEEGDFDHETWTLVLFIRHLPHLTADDETAMEEFNPKSNAERKEEKQEEEFLNGKTNKEGSHEH